MPAESQQLLLEKTLRLLALVALRDMRQREQVGLLDRAGFGQNEIAQILQSTPKAISVRLAEIRAERKRNARSKR